MSGVCTWKLAPSTPARVAALAWAGEGGESAARRLPPDALVAPWEDALVALVGDPEAPGLEEVHGVAPGTPRSSRYLEIALYDVRWI